MRLFCRKKTEEVIFHLLNNLFEETKEKNLCLTGGVVMNSVANGLIIKKTPFGKLYILPFFHDAGNALGAAFYLWNILLNNPRSIILVLMY